MNSSEKRSPFLQHKLATAGVVIKDPGYQSITISKNLTADELIETLTSEAVPYIECGRKCLASEICPYTKPDPHWPGRLLEIKCGYQIAAIRHFLFGTLPTLKPRTSLEMQSVLDACMSFKEFAFGLFFSSAGIGDPAHARWGGSYYLSIAHSHARQAIRGASRFVDSLRPFTGRYIRPTAVFVEGKSELVVLSAAFERRDDLEIRSLGGNARMDFLRASLEECRRSDVLAGLILDRSTKLTTSKVYKLADEGLIPRRNVKFLAGDFEDLFQFRLLSRIAVETLKGLRLEGTRMALEDRVGCHEQGFSRCLRRHLMSVGVEPVQLDSAVADVKSKLSTRIATQISEDRFAFDSQVHATKVPGRRQQPVSQFIHLCRWILGVEGSDVRQRYLTEVED